MLGVEEWGGVVEDFDGEDFVAGAVVFDAPFTGVEFADDGVDDIHAVGDFTKNRVAVIEVWGGSHGDEELGSVGVCARIGHRDDAGFVVFEFGMEFVLELVTRSAATGFSGVAALDHEVIDDAVEGDAIVVAALGEVEKIGGGNGGFAGEDGGIDLSFGGSDFDVDILDGLSLCGF